MMNDSDLAKAGIPFSLWRVDFTSDHWQGNTKYWEELLELVADPQALYDSGTSIVIPSFDTLDLRMRLVAWMAQSFGNAENIHYRINNEPKRSEPTTLGDGTLFTQPFKVKMIDVEALERWFKEVQRDDDREWAYEVCLPDFAFLIEVGSEIGSSSFTASIIEQFLLERQYAALPTVVSQRKPSSEIIDRSGNKVYAEVAAIMARGVEQGLWRRVKRG